MNRRDFLKYCTAMGLSFPLANNSHAASQAQRNTLLLIELQGGNDGLNTVIPYADPRYYELRPTIAIDRSEVIELNASLGLHPSLQALLPIWQQQQLQIMLGVGYHNPNLSHFRSIEIWNTASRSDQYLDQGWLASKLAQQNAAIDGLVLGGQFGPLSGAANTVQIRNIEQFLKQSRHRGQHKQHHAQHSNNPALNHLLQTQSVIDQAADTLKTQLKKLQAPQAFDKNAFARQMQLATQIIQSDLNIPVIKVRLNGFDTHANQKGTHARLLKTLADSIAASQQALQVSGHWPHVTMMTYSEFGRRAKENGSRGTDHGTAAPHFILGGSVMGGFSGHQPSLTDLDNHNLKYTTDFKQLFAQAKL